MKANLPFEPRHNFRQFDANIYAALAGKEPVVSLQEPKRAHYIAIPAWLAHSLSDRFPTARTAVIKRFGEARARVTRCITTEHGKSPQAFIDVASTRESH